MSEQKTSPFSFEKASKQLNEFYDWGKDPVSFSGDDGVIEKAKKIYNEEFIK